MSIGSANFKFNTETTGGSYTASGILTSGGKSTSQMSSLQPSGVSFNRNGVIGGVGLDNNGRMDIRHASDILMNAGGGIVLNAPDDGVGIYGAYGVKLVAAEEMVEIESNYSTVIKSGEEVDITAPDGLYLNNKAVYSDADYAYKKETLSIKNGQSKTFTLDGNYRTLVFKGRISTSDSWQTIVVPIEDLTTTAQPYIVVNLSGTTPVWMKISVLKSGNNITATAQMHSTIAANAVWDCVYIKR